jgi:hypothetical protein
LFGELDERRLLGESLNSLFDFIRLRMSQDRLEGGSRQDWQRFQCDRRVREETDQARRSRRTPQPHHQQKQQDWNWNSSRNAILVPDPVPDPDPTPIGDQIGGHRGVLLRSSDDRFETVLGRENCGGHETIVSKGADEGVQHKVRTGKASFILRRLMTSCLVGHHSANGNDQLRARGIASSHHWHLIVCSINTTMVRTLQLPLGPLQLLIPCAARASGPRFVAAPLGVDCLVLLPCAQTIIEPEPLTLSRVVGLSILEQLYLC